MKKRLSRYHFVVISALNIIILLVSILTIIQINKPLARPTENPHTFLESLPEQSLDTNFFRETKIGQRILAYLYCLDFDCIDTLQALVETGPDAVPPLIQILQFGVPSEIALELSGDVPTLVRAKVIDALGALADTRALTSLIAVLKDSNPLLRAGAAKALGRIGEDAALPALLPLLYDPDPFVRETTVEALGEIGQPDALPALRKAFQSEPQEHIRNAIDKAIKILEQH